MVSKPYRYEDIGSKQVLQLVTRASALLSRLDERIANSRVAEGWIKRMHFVDACASLWLDGELVHMEDLVLHDAGQDIRAPTHALTIAQEVLRLRRRISSEGNEFKLTVEAIRKLRGAENKIAAPERKSLVSQQPAKAEDDHLAAEIARIDALLSRSDAILKGQILPSKTQPRDPLIYDAEWDEDERLHHWSKISDDIVDYPPALQAAILLDAWREMEVLQHQSWIGRLLSASVLRKEGVVTHAPAFNLGLRAIPRENRTSKNPQTRLIANLEALISLTEIGFKEHDRLSLAYQVMTRRLAGRRSSSKLAEAIDCVLSHPVVSTQMIAQAAQVTPRAALRLIEELNLREVTGRGRFRAWGIM